MDIPPVTKEFLIRQFPLLSYAINKFNHDFPVDWVVSLFFQRPGPFVFSTVARSSHSHKADLNVPLQLSRLRGRAVRTSVFDSNWSRRRFRFLGKTSRLLCAVQRCVFVGAQKLNFC